MGYILTKIKDNIRKYGFFTFVKRACKKTSNILLTIIYNIVFSKKYNKQLCEILENNNEKKIIVFYPFFDFNMPNFQRFQQIAIALGEKDNVLFFYCTPNNVYDSLFGFKKIKNNLYLTNQYSLLINRDIKNRIIYFVSTDVKSTINDIERACLRGDKVIYDYVDEMHEDIIGNINTSQLKKHEFVLKNENIFLIVTADKLLKEVHKYRTNNVYLVSNGVRIEDFIIEKECDYKNEKLDILRNFKCKYRITICYYGAFAKWFDYDLLKYVSKNSDIGIVLIGVDYDMSLKNSNLLGYENVCFLGLIEYKDLKFFASECDIMTIPFIVNEITDSTSPVKLFEYMALKKPILATNMLECKKYKSVSIAKNYDEFVHLIYSLYEQLSKNSFDFKSTFKEAKENSWGVKANKIIRIINNDT